MGDGDLDLDLWSGDLDLGSGKARLWWTSGSVFVEILTRLRAVLEISLDGVDNDPGWSICDMDEGNGTPRGDGFDGKGKPGLRPGIWGGFITPAAIAALSNCSAGRP